MISDLMLSKIILIKIKDLCWGCPQWFAIPLKGWSPSFFSWIWVGIFDLPDQENMVGVSWRTSKAGSWEALNPLPQLLEALAHRTLTCHQRSVVPTLETRWGCLRLTEKQGGLAQAHSATQSCQGTTHVNEAAWTPQVSSITSWDIQSTVSWISDIGTEHGPS